MNTELLEVPDIDYPESDGLPMADNSLQWQWIVKIAEELEALLDGQNAAVHSDMFWYPVRGKNTIVLAPDVMVIFGRPASMRGSYKQWEEENIAPQVVFEVLSPSNTTSEMEAKREFYETHGVQEFYIIDPYDNLVEGYRRTKRGLIAIPKMHGHVSPLLGIRFEMNDLELVISKPDGSPFQSRRDAELKRRREIEKERQRTEHERKEKEKLAKKLRELGIDPDTLK